VTFGANWLCPQQEAIMECLVSKFGRGWAPGGNLTADLWDNASLTQFCFAHAGIDLPFSPVDMYQAPGQELNCSSDAVASGDVMFYKEYSSAIGPVDMVGIFWSNTDIVQLPSETKDHFVKIYPDIWDNGYWTNNYVSWTEGKTRKVGCKRFWSCPASDGCPQQDAILNCLEAQLGKPYADGASGPNRFDAAGLTQYCLGQAGISITRGAARQAVASGGVTVDCHAAQPGDLIFYLNNGGTAVSFVGAFKNGIDVYQIHSTNGVQLRVNIFEDYYYGSLIHSCKRFWSCSVSYPTHTATPTAGQSPLHPPRTPEPTSIVPADLSPQQRAIVSCMVDQLGKGWSSGGEGPDTFDASGLTKYCFGQAGISLPQGSYEQSLFGTEVSCQSAEPGDLIFYGNPADFVGTFVSDYNVIQTPQGFEVGLYPDIFSNAIYSPLIYKCRRHWSYGDDVSVAPVATDGPTPEGPVVVATPNATPLPTSLIPLNVSDQQTAIMSCLVEQLGKPYRVRVAGPDHFDGPGLTTYCFRRAGIELPHNVTAQSEGGTRISCLSAEPGDLIFYFDPASFVGVFQSSRNVIQIDDGRDGVAFYPDIFDHGYYGQEIALCKRYWDNSATVPSGPFSDPTEPPSDPFTASDTFFGSLTLPVSPSLFSENFGPSGEMRSSVDVTATSSGHDSPEFEVSALRPSIALRMSSLYPLVFFDNSQRFVGSPVQFPVTSSARDSSGFERSANLAQSTRIRPSIDISITSPYSSFPNTSDLEEFQWDVVGLFNWRTEISKIGQTRVRYPVLEACGQIRARHRSVILARRHRLQSRVLESERITVRTAHAGLNGSDRNIQNLDCRSRPAVTA
jgi:cell wall-associated NlpC family hydrolase